MSTLDLDAVLGQGGEMTEDVRLLGASGQDCRNNVAYMPARGDSVMIDSYEVYSFLTPGF